MVAGARGFAGSGAGIATCMPTTDSRPATSDSSDAVSITSGVASFAFLNEVCAIWRMSFIPLSPSASFDGSAPSTPAASRMGASSLRAESAATVAAPDDLAARLRASSSSGSVPMRAPSRVSKPSK